MTRAFEEFIRELEKPLEYAFGCRHPESEEGSWDKAFVFGKCIGGDVITMAMFDNGKDFVGYVTSYAYAYEYYQKYIDDGWRPMTAIDLQKTAGLTLETDKTLVVPWKPCFTWNSNSTKYLLYGGLVTLLISLFIFKKKDDLSEQVLE